MKENGNESGRAKKAILHFMKKKTPGFIGLVILILLVLVAIFADVLAPVKMQQGTLPGNPLFNCTHPWWMLDDSQKQLEISMGTIYWLGTDNLGRDVLSYIIYGARTSVILCIGVTLLTTLVALVIGITSAGYDLIVQRIVDAWQCIPGMLISILIMNILGKGMLQMILVMAIPGGIGQSRLFRSAAMSMKDSGYVEASGLMGGTAIWKMLQHVGPDIMPIIVVTAAGGLGSTVMMEAALNFLGFGVKVGTPSWGYMITNQGRANMYTAPYLSIIPGISIGIMVLAANIFGDSIRDELDPRLRGVTGSLKANKLEKIRTKLRGQLGLVAEEAD